jgi:hypothetical protein
VIVVVVVVVVVSIISLLLYCFVFVYRNYIVLCLQRQHLLGGCSWTACVPGGMYT